MFEEKKNKLPQDPEPPRIIEKKELEIELFSDEPDPWGP